MLHMRSAKDFHGSRSQGKFLGEACARDKIGQVLHSYISIIHEDKEIFNRKNKKIKGNSIYFLLSSVFFDF